MSGRFGVQTRMKAGTLRFLLPWLFCVLPVLGDVAESGVFALDTLSAPPQAGSVFTVDTRVSSAQSSQAFLCSTLQVDRQESGSFVCDLRPAIQPSGLFIVDTMSIPVDTDGDGLPNVWEMRYFGGTTAAASSADVDADGADNYAEYIAGTVPTDAQSLFAVQISSGLNIEWQTIQNRSYTLQITPDLMVPFSDVPGQVDLYGTGDTMSVPLSTESSNGFYRVVIRLY